MTQTAEDLRARLDSIGQGHLLHFFDDLSEGDRRGLLDEISAIDLERLPKLIETYVTNKPSFVPSGACEPAPYYPNDPASPVRAWDLDKHRAIGEELLRAGKVAAFVVAGGQGSRLGFDGPKGKFPGGAVSNKPLFRMLAEWIVASREAYGCAIPWYVMTSPLNHDETVAFFDEHNRFGLPASDVSFFQQGTLPSIDMATGRVLLKTKSSLATNPDGHGGSLKALYASGSIDEMIGRGIEHISYVQIDNPIARVIDPVFIGLHAGAEDSSGEMSTKMVPKAEPSEKVGVLCRVDNKTQVIEYSDLSDDLAQQRDERGDLRYCAGNIAIHMIGVDFVRRLNTEGDGFALPLHRAEKKVACIDPGSGDPVEPDAPNAIKLETFVFDALPMCESSIVYETDRVDEFAPIKNTEGSDSPASSARIQTERGARWLEAAGISVPRDANGEPDCTLEIGPRFARSLEELASKKDELPATIDAGSSHEFG
ncbi:MAG: UDPGP type 1 family protein [Planctomycetota bacterium]